MSEKKRRETTGTNKAEDMTKQDHDDDVNVDGVVSNKDDVQPPSVWNCTDAGG